jgi:hypothetical protein
MCVANQCVNICGLNLKAMSMSANAKWLLTEVSNEAWEMTVSGWNEEYIQWNYSIQW